MCPKPKIKDPQLYQAEQAPVFNEAAEEDDATRRGRRGTIIASAMGNAGSAGVAGGKTRLGQ